jgi:hypothetical protein
MGAVAWGLCPLVSDLRDLVVAELAVGIADRIGDRGAVIVTERLQLLDRGGIVVAVIDRGVGRAITLCECRIDPRTIVALLLSLVLPSDFGGGASLSGLALAVVSTAGRSA